MLPTLLILLQHTVLQSTFIYLAEVYGPLWGAWYYIEANFILESNIFTVEAISLAAVTCLDVVHPQSH